MAREFFKNLPDTTTPLNAPRLNNFLNGNEAMGSIVADDITCKNILEIATNSQTSNGITKTYNSETKKLVYSGTATAAAYLRVSYDVYLEANKTYTISTNENLPSGVSIYANDYANVGLVYADLTISSNSKAKTFTPTKAGTINFAIVINSGTAVDLSLSVQLEKGLVATEHVEHKEFGYFKKSNSFIQGSSNGYGSNETVSTNETLDILTTTITTNESILLIQPFVRVGVSDNNCFMHIYLDNVRIGTWAINTSNAYMSPVISKKVSAGEHTIKVQIEGSNAATTTVYGFPTKTLNVVEI